jgi:hypothetical protein
MNVEVPPGLPLRIGPGVLSDRPSRDLIPDTVIMAGPEKYPARGIIVEIQKDRKEEKRRQLPRYAAALWLQFDCPADVLVICPDDTTAAWYAAAIPTTLDGYTYRPKVLLPSRVPKTVKADEMAADPAMAVLSVAYHGDDPAVAEAFVAGITSPEVQNGEAYYEYGYIMSTTDVRAALEALVTTYERPTSPFLRKKYDEGVEEGLEKGLEKGLVEGERNTVLMVLKARGLRVTDAQRDLINTCTDLEQLKNWAEAAVTAATAADIFG